MAERRDLFLEGEELRAEELLLELESLVELRALRPRFRPPLPLLLLAAELSSAFLRLSALIFRLSALLFSFLSNLINFLAASSFSQGIGMAQRKCWTFQLDLQIVCGKDAKAAGKRRVSFFI